MTLDDDKPLIGDRGILGMILGVVAAVIVGLALFCGCVSQY